MDANESAYGTDGLDVAEPTGDACDDSYVHIYSE